MALRFAAWTALPNVLSASLVYATGARGAACPATSLRPPGWVFGVVWPALYLAVGVATALLAEGRHLRELLIVLAVLVGLNAWWLAFSRRCRPVPALAAIVALLAGSAYAASQAMAVDSTAGALMWPLVGWMSFATLLSVQQAA